LTIGQGLEILPGGESVRKVMMPYTLTTPWRWETYGAGREVYNPYSRLAGKPIDNGNITGTINPFLTDIPRGYTFIVNGATVTTEQTPSQDTLAAADSYYLGGTTNTISNAEAQIFINAGYSSFVTLIV
tara:strand:+ start:1220 stop:1606 length:387 start_codon:yes stop_codon:yes gene_type:complete